MMVLLLGALLALGLETAGTSPGGRKRVGRTPNVVVVVVAAIVAVIVDAGATPAASLAVAVALSVFALAEGKDLLGERAALALVLGAGTLKLQTTTSPLALLGYLALWAVVTAGLSMRSGNGLISGAEAEAAAKAALLGIISLLIGGLGVVVGGGAGDVCWLVALGLVLGLTPLQGIRVDVAQGAPPAAVALSAPLALVALGPVLPRYVDAASAGVEIAVALGLFAVPLVALAQTSLRRLLAVLLVGQAVLPLVAACAGSASTEATLAAALGAVGLAVGVQALPALATSSATWEDASGQGRKHPWRAGLLVFAAAQACGLPPTSGFAVRETLAGALAASQPWMAVGLLAGAALSALPVVRLALFLFAKEPRPSPPPPPGIGAVLALGAVVFVGVTIGVLHPFLFR